MAECKNMGTTCRNLTNTLRPLSETWKRRVRERYHLLCGRPELRGEGGVLRAAELDAIQSAAPVVEQGRTTLDDEHRGILAQAIFSLEDEHEYSLGSNHAQIRTLRAIRCILLDDLSGTGLSSPEARARNLSENLPGSRYPFIESVAEIIREKHRKGGPGASPERMRAISPRRPGAPFREDSTATEPSRRDDMFPDGCEPVPGDHTSPSDALAGEPDAA
jgi:hypothetical protein